MIKIKRLSLSANKRIIAISDIHGNLDVFKRLLEKIKFSDIDTLFLVGDIVEKGDDNLDTLNFVIELTNIGNTNVLIGNNDNMPRTLILENGYDNYFIKYIRSRKNLVREICERNHLDILNHDYPLDFIKKTVLDSHGHLIRWLDSLPHIIETENFVFAHAGIENKPLEDQDLEFVLSASEFQIKSEPQKKFTITGHWPAVNYAERLLDNNPRIDREKKVICIDGGNMVKHIGQINALMFDNSNTPHFDSAYADSFDYIPSTYDFSFENMNTISLGWLHNEVEILSEGSEFSECLHIQSGKKLIIPNRSLRNEDGITRAYNVTDFRHTVKKGDLICVIEAYSDRLYIKKDGIAGWVDIVR